MTVSAPRYLFLESTSECNLRCGHCHLWQSHDEDAALTTKEKVALVRQLAGWADRAVVVVTGGEPLRKPDELFAITRECRRHGLSSATNTNATLIDAPMVGRLLEEGPRWLVVSLDSHRPELFDRTRGVPGTFARVVDTLRALVTARRQRPESDVRILTSTILFDENAPEIERVVALADDLGVDGMLFQPLSRTFALRSRRDAFFDRHRPRDFAVLDDAVDRLIDLKRAGAPIETSEGDLHWMKLYARDPDFIGEQVCGSGERNVMIDHAGRVQLCFRMHDLMGGRFLGNVREQPLRVLLESDFAAEARGVMAACRKNCGMLNCHRKIA